MSLPRLASPPRAALHSSRRHLETRSRRTWLRDTTVWLALGLSIATTMVVLARTTGGTPRALTDPAAIHAGVGDAAGSRSRTTASTPVRSHLRAPTPKRSSTAATKTATTTTVVTRPARTTATRPAQVTDVTTTPRVSPSISLVSEQWAGALTYPDDVATSYSFTTTGGTVVVRTSLLRGAAALSSSLQCSGSSVLGGSHTGVTTMKAPAGPCTYNLQFIETAFADGARAVYQITAQYPAAIPAS
jgi:hypothetical protein